MPDISPPNYLYSGLLLAAGIICVLVGLLAWQLRGSSRGVPALFFFLTGLGWWDITYAIFWADLPGPVPYFWLDMTYLGAVMVPSGLFIFALQMSEQESWLKPPTLVALAVEPILVLVALWTDPWHGLFFGGMREANTGMILNAGAVYWANLVYSYVLVLMAMILFVRSYLRSKGLYRKQFATVLVGIGITWLNSIIFVAGFNPLPGADNTPFSFTITGMVFAHAIFRYRLLDVVPIARSMLVDSMSDGLVVLDAQNRIVDMNPVARRSLPHAEIGTLLQSLGQKLPEALKQYTEASNLRTEVVLDNPQRYLDIQVSTVQDARQRTLGKLVVWRDITELKQLQNKLHELATHDALTRAYNRNHFEELAEKEWQRSLRHQHPLALILLDIDHFKKINDTYGHPAGDWVLIEFTNLCQRAIRTQDIFARWGGEEFIILLPETAGEDALQFAERLRNNLTETRIEIGGEKINMTCSLGVSARILPQDSFKSLLKRTDDALYEAKNCGRNCSILR